MCQSLSAFHHTALSLLRVKGHFLDRQIFFFLLCLTLIQQEKKIEWHLRSVNLSVSKF